MIDHSLPLKSIRASAVVDKKIIAEYVGVYEMTPSFSIAITSSNGSLFLQATGQGKFQLFSESVKKFFLKVVDAQIEFVREDKEQVEKLLLYQNGAIQSPERSNEAIKIKSFCVCSRQVGIRHTGVPFVKPLCLCGKKPLTTKIPR